MYNYMHYVGGLKAVGVLLWRLHYRYRITNKVVDISFRIKFDIC